MDGAACQCLAPQCLHQRPEQLARLPDPVRQGGGWEFDALPGIDLALPVQGKVIAVLGDQHMRQQPRAGDSARNRAFRRLSLNQCRTAGAGQFGAHMADHTEAGRYKLQHLSDVFADAAQVATAPGAAGLIIDTVQVDIPR